MLQYHSDIGRAAVRIATEINLHRAFVQPDYDSREWYLVCLPISDFESL